MLPQSKVRLFLYVLLFFCILPTLGESKEMRIVSEGVGAIIDGNRARARDIAVQDALRKAVEQAMGIYVNAETIVQNAVLIRDNIYC